MNDEGVLYLPGKITKTFNMFHVLSLMFLSIFKAQGIFKNIFL